jgi:signal transduction histidine kinase
MSAIASRSTNGLAVPELFRRYWIEGVCSVWMALNVVAIVIVPEGETVPFHFVWVTLSLAYCFRMWRLRATIWALLAVCVGTAIALGSALTQATATAGFDEMAEVPLMGLMFVAMMWHVERRQAAMEEIHRLAESEHRLLERQRNLVRDASHQLRTPITIARGHAELIRSNYTGEQTAEDADVILDELSRLSKIAERFLILGAAEHPDFLSLQPLDVGRLVAETGRRWSGAAVRCWQVQVDEPVTLVGDEERLGYTLDALIENAVKYTAEGNVITIGARSFNGQASVTVSDTGPGIPQHDLARIFERFARVENGGKRNGTGLGLAIVKAIVEAHGGEVHVTSELGRGTTFELRLPKLQRNRAVNGHVSPRPTGDAAGATARGRPDRP